MYTRIFLLATLIPEFTCNKTPIITTLSGKIQGSIKKSYNGRQYMSFEGIPYAKPPIGYHRFDAPTFINPWKGVWNATTFYTCTQILPDDTIMGDDDCLYLNIYVPIKQNSLKTLLNVIVHIHGGGFMWGSGHDYAHPNYLMDRDIIFITINYRLGIFGFLSTGTVELPGNNGLKDQTLALKWIQMNIEAFSGNPNSITISGMSAGAASVHYHYLSSLSKGLFHRGISNSGTVLNLWSLEMNPRTKTDKIAKEIGCPTNNTNDLVDCLKQRPTNQLLKAVIRKFEPYFRMFKPVIEPKTTKRPFITEHPYYLLKMGFVNPVPWLTSMVVNEAIFLKSIINVTTTFEDYLMENWPKEAEILLSLPKDSQIDKIFNYYTNNTRKFNKKQQKKLFTDRYFAVDIEKSVKLHSKYGRVYFYYFNYKGSLSFSQEEDVGHMEDGLYMFFNMIPNTTLSENDLKMKDAFLNFFELFANDDKTLKFDNIEWIPTKSNQLTYLNITNIGATSLITVDELSPLKFWHNLGIKENENLFNIKEEL